MWQSEYLVSVCLNSTGFVDAYMSDLCCDHTLIAFKQCIDYSSIGLGAAYQKENFSFRTATGRFDLFFGSVTIWIQSISTCFFKICLYKFLKNGRMSPFHIVTGKR